MPFRSLVSSASDLGNLADTVLLNEDEIAAAADPLPRPRCGIYFLVQKGKIVYVGRALDIDRRLMSEEHARKVYDSVAWVPCAQPMQATLERAYICKFLPPLNRDPETNTTRLRAAQFGTSTHNLTPRVSEGRLTPRGCYWRGEILWARIKVADKLLRKSMQTADPDTAIQRRARWVEQMKGPRGVALLR